MSLPLSRGKSSTTTTALSWDTAIRDAKTELKEAKVRQDAARIFDLSKAIRGFRKLKRADMPWSIDKWGPYLKSGGIIVAMDKRTGLAKKIKREREGPLRIPLPFEEVISDVLKVKPEAKPATKKKREH